MRKKKRMGDTNQLQSVKGNWDIRWDGLEQFQNLRPFPPAWIAVPGGNLNECATDKIHI